MYIVNLPLDSENILQVKVLDKDWDFLCQNRFFTDTPTQEMIFSEFVTGTGITPNKKNLWNEASERFAEYVNDLREIQKNDIDFTIICPLERS